MIQSILIIDDDLVSQFASRYTIRQCNVDCDILVCDGAQEGLDILSEILKKGEDFPEYIFLDLSMPIMDGWDFLDQFLLLGDKTKKTKIYILSAFTISKGRAKAKQHPMVEGYFDKPLTKNKLNEIFVTKLI